MLELMPYLVLFTSSTTFRGPMHARNRVLVYTGLHIFGDSRASLTPDAMDADQPSMEVALGNRLHRKRKIDPPRRFLFRQRRLIDGEPPFIGIYRLRQTR